MRLLRRLNRRRKEAELAARRARTERVAEHSARKAQSGTEPLPLPE